MRNTRAKVNPIDNVFHLEGNEAVIRRLFEKKQLMQEGRAHEHIRPLLLVMSGGMRGVYGAGSLLTLQDNGLTDVFDTLVGISTGAPSGAYFLAGQVETGASVYLEECVRHPFFSFTRPLTNHGAVEDVDYLVRVIRGREGDKKLNQNKIRESRTQLYFVVAHFETGKQEFLNAKEFVPDIAKGIAIGIDLPLVYRNFVEYEGEKYLDGGIVDSFPIKKIIELFKPTDILILPNISERDVMRGKDAEDTIYCNAAKLVLPKPFVSKMESNYARFIRSLAWLRAGGAKSRRWLIVWPDDKVGKMTQNARVLKAAFTRSVRFFGNYLSSKGK